MSETILAGGKAGIKPGQIDDLVRALTEIFKDAVRAEGITGWARLDAELGRDVRSDVDAGGRGDVDITGGSGSGGIEWDRDKATVTRLRWTMELSAGRTAPKEA